MIHHRHHSGSRPLLWGLSAPLFALGLLLTGLHPSTVSAAEGDTDFPWVLEADEAMELLDNDNPTLLDTRSTLAYHTSHLPGAVRIRWKDFTPATKAERGRLLADDTLLQERLRKLGISNERPVLVVGAPPDNWGEDGRIVWMLRTLGHRRVALVDGGWRALKEAGADGTIIPSSSETGDFEIDRRDDWQIDRHALRRRLDAEEVALVDTRQKREYDGATPYGESRPGHLPGAVHLHYTDLLDDDGKLKPDDALRTILKKHGILPNKSVVAYCTGGVRSAWFTVVLRHLGYGDVRNYAGSAWEWSAGPAEKYPLETD